LSIAQNGLNEQVGPPRGEATHDFLDG